MRASGALCRAADSSARAPIPRLRTPCRVVSSCFLRHCCRRPAPLRVTTHRDFRCARSAVTAAGLGRRTTTDQCAFHRFDPSFAAQVGSAPLVVHARSLAPHPVACHDPCLPRQRREVRFKLSLAPDAASPFTSRKMRLSDFCNRLYKTSTLRTVRFPVALLVHPTCVGASLAFASIERRHVLGLGPHGSGGWEPRIRLPDEPPSGASLDGESPASASAATLTCASEDEPRGAMVIRPRAVLVELRSLLLCAGPPDPGVFSLEPSMRRSL